MTVYVSTWHSHTVTKGILNHSCYFWDGCTYFGIISDQGTSIWKSAQLDSCDLIGQQKVTNVAYSLVNFTMYVTIVQWDPSYYADSISANCKSSRILNTYVT